MIKTGGDRPVADRRRDAVSEEEDPGGLRLAARRGDLTFPSED